MRLRLDPHEYVVAREESGAWSPRAEGELSASILGPDGHTVVCRAGLEPASADRERGWRLLRTDEPMGFSEVGVVASIVGPLAAAGVAVFVVSTFSADWVLVKEAALPLALEALRATDHTVLTDG